MPTANSKRTIILNILVGPEATTTQTTTLNKEQTLTLTSVFVEYIYTGSSSAQSQLVYDPNIIYQLYL